MGIFDRFSRLVRAELNHRTGGRSAVDPARRRASEPGDKRPPEPSAEVLPPELPPELTCPPEDYRTAKFSLAAYLLCWALLRWYQVRIFVHLHLICGC